MYLKNSNKIKLGFSNSSDSTSTDSMGGWRLFPLYLLISFVFVFIVFNLFKLQIVEGDKYLLKSSLIATKDNVILPPRGLIMDRNYSKLAFNIPSYTLFINPSEVLTEEETQIIDKIAVVFNLDKDALMTNYKEKVYLNDVKQSTGRVSIINGIDFDKYIDSVGALEGMRGVYIQVEAVRSYVDSNYFAHIIGYVGDPSPDNVANGIYPRSQIGKLGVEKSYDKELRGEEGLEVIENNLNDDLAKTYQSKEVKYGDNLILTIDSRWQKKLTDILSSEAEAMKAFGGAAVIMNSDTGEIMAMVSIPTYDNSMFINGISSSDYSKFISDPKRPQMNRAIAAQLPPGSIFKVVGATAGLEQGVVTPNTEFLSDRCMELPGKIQFCEANKSYIGSINITQAIARSSNIYFCNLALGLEKKDGIAGLVRYADLYGIGNLTGIDIPGEEKGQMASPELKRKLWDEPWYVGDSCNTIIGQGLLTVTPLQMTVVASAINNGGDILKPHLLSKVSDQQGNVVSTNNPDILRKLDVKPNTLTTIKTGMKQAAKNGTASKLNSLPNEIMAKTGSAETCETIDGKSYCGAHSWVMGCFEAESQNYCFTVLHQWGGWGYNSVPTAKKFINCVNKDFADGCEKV